MTTTLNNDHVEGHYVKFALGLDVNRNPLKRRRVTNLFFLRFSSYLAVDTRRLGYKAAKRFDADPAKHHAARSLTNYVRQNA